MKFRIFALLFILIIVASCSPEHRLLRFTENHPELFEKDSTEVTVSVPIEETIFLESTSAEESFNYKRLGKKQFKLETPEFETFIRFYPNLGNDLRFKIKTIVKEQEITIRDTIEREIKVGFLKPKPIIVEVKKTPLWAKVVLGLFIVLVIAIVLAFFGFMDWITKIGKR